MPIWVSVMRLSVIGMRIAALLCLALFAALPMRSAESCMTIHGRVSFASGDSQLRIWHIGTHHEYEPDESSMDTVLGWLEAGIKGSDRSNYVSPASAVFLFGDFLVCPTEPFKKGSVQQAKVKSVSRRHYVRVN
jgi:hypothetical protein